MLNIKDLNGAKLKKVTGLKKITKRYHNVDNFGFTIVNKKDEYYNMSGYFDRKTGKINQLSLGTFRDMPSAINCEFIGDVIIPLRMLDK